MKKGVKKKVFITGMLRSGTTLLDKILNGHSVINIASQPFFGLFVYAKEKYFDQVGIKCLPLSPHFCEPLHLRQNLDPFLESFYFDDSDMAWLRQSIHEKNRPWSPAVNADVLEQLHPGTFFQLLEQGMTLIAQVYGSPEDQIIGIKEVLCEEFLSYLIGKGFKCMIVGRDPRAVISSVSTGHYEKYVGRIRPILLDIRNWRKSIAYAILLKENPNFHFVRYEDLVSNPAEELKRITKFLGVGLFDKNVSKNPLMAQDGEIWKGNSSYGEKKGISRDSLDAWKANLSVDEVTFIEYCCCGEMAYLGYDFCTNPMLTEISEFRSEFRTQKRNDYAPEHLLGAENLAREKDRFICLTKGTRPDNLKLFDYFLTPDVWQILHSSVLPYLKDDF